MNEWKKAGQAQTHKWDLEENKIVQGVLTAIRKIIVNEKETSLYDIEIGKGKHVAVWSTAMLLRLMSEVKLGQEVRIEYMGETKNNKGGKLKVFDVTYRGAPLGVEEAKEIFGS